MSGGISGENLRHQPQGGALFVTMYRTGSHTYVGVGREQPQMHKSKHKCVMIKSSVSATLFFLFCKFILHHLCVRLRPFTSCTLFAPEPRTRSETQNNVRCTTLCIIQQQSPDSFHIRFRLSCMHSRTNGSSCGMRVAAAEQSEASEVKECLAVGAAYLCSLHLQPTHAW